MRRSPQTINVQIGENNEDDASDYFGTINISNNAGAIFNKDIYVTNLTTNDNLFTFNGANLDVTGGTNSETSGSGALTLSGTDAQTINSAIGTDTTKFGAINISNTNNNGVTFKKNIYATLINDQTSDKDASITFSKGGDQIIDSVIGDSETNFGNIIIRGGTRAALEQDVYVNNLSIYYESSYIIGADNVTLNISGDIESKTGTNKTDVGIIKDGTIDDTGTLTLSGTDGAQTIAATIGTSSDKFGTINIGDGTSATEAIFKQNIYTNNLTLKGKSKLNIDVSQDALISAASVNLNSNSVIDIDYSNINDLAADASYEIIDEITSYKAADNISVIDNSFLLASTLLYENNVLKIKTELDSANDLDESTLIITENIISLKAVNASFESLSDEIYKISDEKTLNDVTESLDISHNNEVGLSSLAISAQSADVVSNHNSFAKSVATSNSESNSDIYGSNSESGYSSGNNINDEFGVWGQVFGGSAIQRKRNGEAGYDSKTYGLVFGYDILRKVNDSKYSIIGGAVTYANASVESDSTNNQNTDVNSIQLSLYQHNFKKGNIGFYNEQIANIAFNKNESTRLMDSTSTTEQVSAKYNSMEMGAQITMGHNRKMFSKFLAGPSLSLRYGYLITDDYQEKGALGLEFKSRDLETLTSILNYNIHGKIDLDNAQIFPKLNIGWIRNLKTEGSVSELGFVAGGKSVTTTSSDLIENLLNVGIEFTIPDDDNSLSIKYDLKNGSGFTSHSASLKYKIVF